MSARLLLYGATGLSGASLAEALRDLGPRLVIAARDAAAIAALGERLQVAHRAFDLSAADAIDRSIADVDLVLNAAGPFAQTAPTMIDACLRRGIDYLDLSGEWPTIEHAMNLSSEAKQAGIMLLPSVALAGAVTDCLLARVARRAEAPVGLRLGLSTPHAMSKGSLATMIGLASSDTLVRRHGALQRVPAGRLTHDFDFGQGPRRAVAVSWPDIVTAQFSTGVDTIAAFSQAGTVTRLLTPVGAAAAPLWRQPPVEAALRGIASRWPAPRSPHGFTIVAEAEDRWRRTTRMRIATLDGYSTTTAVAGAIARRVLAGARRPGFATASSLLGPDFLLSLPHAIADVSEPDISSRETRHAVR